jgi:hypothetical protein
MNDLINTLLDCPNLSLRILDTRTGRTVKTITGDQLHRFAQAESAGCAKDCDNMACANRAPTEKL